MAETLYSSSTPIRPPAPGSPASFYARVAAHPDDEAEAVMLRTLARELRLDPETRRAAIHERYRGWLKLTPEQGARVAAAYDRAHGHLKPEQQIALDETERDVVRHGLSFQEFEYLSQFVPWLRAWYVPPAFKRPVSGPPAPFGVALALTRN